MRRAMRGPGRSAGAQRQRKPEGEGTHDRKTGRGARGSASPRARGFFSVPTEPSGGLGSFRINARRRVGSRFENDRMESGGTSR